MGSFRSKNDKDDKAGADYRAVTYGSRFALSFLMNPYLEDRISSTFYGDGVKVLIHEPWTYPGSAALEFVAPSGHETVASVHGNRLVSSSDVLNLSEDVRSCVKTEKRDGGSVFPPYRTSNCYAACRERFLKTACKCLPFYAFTVSESESEDIQQCNFSHIPCLMRNIVGTSILKLEDTECRCLPECEDTTYSLATTTIPLNAAESSPAAI